MLSIIAIRRVHRAASIYSTVCYVGMNPGELEGMWTDTHRSGVPLH